jgi:uncharacterized membrane protein
MTLILILGVALWAGAHLFKRLAPARRAALGDKGRGPVALLLLVSVVLMVVGYRGAEPVQVWYPPAFLTHVNNLLVLLAFYLFAASGMKTWIATRIRHPQLTGFKAWAVGHLLVNGDLASVILFGGLLAWAVASVVLINRAQPSWTPPQSQGAAKEAMAAVGTVVLFGVVALIHTWLGYYPFG